MFFFLIVSLCSVLLLCTLRFQGGGAQFVVGAFLFQSACFGFLQVRVVCSKGTYIRALARDIGEALNSGAHLTALRRTRVGEYGEKDCFTLESFEEKKKGAYNVIQIDPSYVPAELERKQVFGVTFEQGRNELDINGELFSNVVTKNKEIPDQALIDMKIAMITLKYTQSNSVCYVKDGQAIGIGAGQQSRIHCTRLAGQKADNWYLRQAPQVLNLPFAEGLGRADRDNAIDVYIGDEYMDVLADGAWEQVFKVKPPVFTREEKRAWLDGMQDVTLGSDAFFPFSDNIERAHKSGVKYIAQPGGSVRDDAVIECCDKYNMVMAFTGIRLFHH